MTFMQMQKTTNIKNNLRLCFMCFLVIYMAVREITPLQFLIDNTLVSVAVFCGGFSFIVWDLFTERSLFKNRAIDLLVLFIAVCGISSLLNYKYGIGGNIKAIAALVLEYFLFFASGRDRTKEQKAKEIRTVMSVLIISWFILVVISLLMYFFSVDFTSETGVWNSAKQGYSIEYQRLWGVFHDPNYASYVSIISIMASLYLMVSLKKVWLYIVLPINILIQFCYITLGGSRSADIIFMVALALGGVYYLITARPFKNKKLMVKAVALTLASLICTSGIINGLKIGLPYVKYAVRDITPKSTVLQVESAYKSWYDFAGINIRDLSEGDEVIEDDPMAPINRTDLEKGDASNGRISRWKDTLLIFSKTPIFGTSPRNLASFAEVHAPDTLMAMYGIAPHNGYLDVLAGSGIVGFAVLATFFILLITAILKNRKEVGYSNEMLLCFLVIIVLAGSAVFVSDIFFVFSIGAVLFFTALGYLSNEFDIMENKGIVCRIADWFFNLFNKKKV